MLTVAGVTALSPVAPMGMGTAQAHEFNAESNITINKRSRFFGKVASSRGKCKKNRNVTLVKKKRNGTRRAVGRDTTNRNGNWSIRTRKKGRFQGSSPRALAAGTATTMSAVATARRPSARRGEAKRTACLKEASYMTSTNRSVFLLAF